MPLPRRYLSMCENGLCKHENLINRVSVFDNGHPRFEILHCPKIEKLLKDKEDENTNNE